jgi:hypothetical protein
MGGLSPMSVKKREDEWQAKATEAAIAAARKIALGSAPLMNTPVGRLTDLQWGYIVTATIFGWIRTRCEQAIAEGIDQEEAVRMTRLSPSPCDIAAITSVLPMLADQARIDWSLPLSAWTKDTMTNFLLLAWRLINKAELARDVGKISASRKRLQRQHKSHGPKRRSLISSPSLPGVDPIRSLRWMLKGLLRHMACDA